MGTPPADDDARWAEARRVLDGLPSETIDARVRRRRRLAILAAVAGVLVAVGLGIALSVVAGDDGGADAERPAWRRIVGLVLPAGAVVLVFSALRIHWRTHRRLGGWRSPLMVLDRQQQKRLDRELRGAEPLDPEHVPLVRHLAEQRLGQRSIIVNQLGLLLIFIGQWLNAPSPWRAAMVGLFVLLIPVLVLIVRRNERPALQFLERHPAPEKSVA